MGINVRHQSILGIAIAGMFAFATAIGIGRFAFTPLLSMMQKDAGSILSMGAWLASANYLGYLVGALSAIWIRRMATTMLRVALISIVVLTLAMGRTHEPALWVALRALAGVASAWGLIFASSAILPRLAAAGEKRLSGVVFGGVGSFPRPFCRRWRCVPLPIRRSSAGLGLYSEPQRWRRPCWRPD
jgi:MFS family permease